MNRLVQLIVLAVLLSGCCVSRDEHRAFVEASRAFFEAVAPVFSDAVATDPELDARNKKNRLGVLVDYQHALSAAEARTR